MLFSSFLLQDAVEILKMTKPREKKNFMTTYLLFHINKKLFFQYLHLFSVIKAMSFKCG